MSASRPLVAVIEDDAPLRRVLRLRLQEDGYDVREAGTGQVGLDIASSKRPDLILLDLGLPDRDGAELIRALREGWPSRPLIVLSGRDSERDKLAALELGADDYITKPFSPSELAARVRAALRRASRHVGADAATAFVSHGVRVDLVKRSVTRNGQEVALTPNEFRVLAMLVRHAGSLVSTAALMAEVWGPDCEPNHRHYLRAYLSNLRHKLEDDPARPALLLTEAGVGYRVATEEADA